jgi:two-component system sensor histidine kinase QseC
VLIAYEYAEVRLQEDANPALERATAQVADILSAVDDPAEARTIVAAIDRSIGTARQRLHVPGAALFQVRDRRDRHLVFLSPAAAGATLLGDPSRQTKQVLHGQTYQVVQCDTPRWSASLAQPRIQSAWLLRSLSGDLTKYMLIAFPFALLPIWLAVTQGLRPLRRLSERIASRSSDDLAPVGIDPKYAELKPLVAAIDGLLAQMLRKIGSEQALVANAAHELRTPLAVISAQAHVLAKASNDQERSEAEQRMDVAISRTSHLVHQLLVLARMETEGRQGLNAVDLAQLARQELGYFVPVAMARNIEISLEAPEQLILPLEVHAFQSVLQNLIDNAVRYGRDGGRIVVELWFVCLGAGILMLSVSDDGLGIAESDRSRIFDRFYRGPKQDATGAGLGLTIVKQATARMGGEVRITSGLDGRGCRFDVHIPAAPMPEGECSGHGPTSSRC